MTREVREDQEKRKMVALTSEEEDERRERERLMRESGEDEGEVARWRRKRREEIHRETMNGHGDRSVKRGGLREVGKEGFVGAVERPGWVVVLIHEPVCGYRPAVAPSRLTTSDGAGCSEMPRHPHIPPPPISCATVLALDPVIATPSTGVQSGLLAVAGWRARSGCAAHDVGVQGWRAGEDLDQGGLGGFGRRC